MKRFAAPLAAQLTLAFWLVSLSALLGVGLISAASTRSEFGTLLRQQERDTVAAQVSAYVEQYGSLRGFRLPPGPPHRSYTVLDAQGRPLDNRPLPPHAAARQPVWAGGQVVAYLVAPSRGPAADGRNAEFLRRTGAAIAWSMLGAALLAAAAGAWLSGQLLRPLTELRGRIAALRRGEAPRHWKVGRPPLSWTRYCTPFTLCTGKWSARGWPVSASRRTSPMTWALR
ncbi:hypothetical protein ACFP81_12065 [Deinococcus lacus]|uniref:Sensor histidine kinase n=1 Tax=Deinococcus lacus TaxID=392561 RepID=A0ABW1YIF9_9DEIO